MAVKGRKISPATQADWTPEQFKGDKLSAGDLQRELNTEGPTTVVVSDGLSTNPQSSVFISPEIVPLESYNPKYYFGRCYKLAIKNIATGYILYIEGLRMEFSYTQQYDEAEENSVGKIVVHNLAYENFKMLDRDYCRVTLYAGYEGQVTELFTTDAINASFEESDGGTKTTIDLTKSFTKNVKKISYQSVENETVGGVLFNIFQQIGYGLTIQFDSQEEGEELQELLTERKFTYGFSSMGTLRSVLKNLLYPLGLRWRFKEMADDDKIVVLVLMKSEAAKTKADEGEKTLRDKNIVYLSPKTGLLGLPVRKSKFVKRKATLSVLSNEQVVGVKYKTSKDGSETKPTTKTLVRFFLDASALLNPRVRCGSPVFISCKYDELSGLYAARRIVYSGDTHGQHWKMDMELEPIKGKLVMDKGDGGLIQYENE